MNNRKYMIVKEVSEYLDIPLRTVYDLIKGRKIKSLKIGGKIRCLTKDIENYANYGTNPAFNQPRNYSCQNDKRKYPRINTGLVCHYSIDLKRLKNIIASGSVLNLSPEGVFIQKENCETIIGNIDDPVAITFRLAFGDEDFKEINVRGRILRKQENGFAVKFRQIDESLKEDIKEYIG